MTTSKHIRMARVAASAAALTLVATVAIGADRSTAPAPIVTVVKTSGTYRIEGSFHAAVGPATAWQVLTDYDRLPSFVESMRSSAASRDADGRLLVTQKATGRAGPFSRTMHVILEVTEAAPARLTFRDVCGSDFDSYTGAWRIDPEGEGVRVTYTLEARPRSAPPLFGRSILAANARGLLEQVRMEIVRRASLPPQSSR